MEENKFVNLSNKMQELKNQMNKNRLFYFDEEDEEKVYDLDAEIDKQIKKIKSAEQKQKQKQKPLLN
jgi:hypothetical protein